MSHESLRDAIMRQVWGTINAYNATKHWEESDIDDFYEELRTKIEREVKEAHGRG